MNQYYEEFNVGDRVKASDGTKRPPDHHNRKLAKWKDRNFTGTVTRVEEARTPFADGTPYMPNGALELKRDDYPDGLHGCITFKFHHDLGGSIVFEKIGSKRGTSELESTLYPETEAS